MPMHAGGDPHASGAVSAEREYLLEASGEVVGEAEKVKAYRVGAIGVSHMKGNLQDVVCGHI
jgi:hypothetical protein